MTKKPTGDGILVRGSSPAKIEKTEKHNVLD